MKNAKSTSSKNVLIFTAHPDDHLCAAGTLMLLKDKGFRIHEVVATGGEKGVWWVSDEEKKANFNGEHLKEERKKEISEASRIIGIDQTTFLGLPDSEVERSYDLIEKLIGLIRKERPDFIFSMSPDDYHHDHREFGKIVTEAAERASWGNLPELGPQLKTPAVLYIEGIYFGRADVLVDITPYRERIDHLLDVYASQIDVSERRLLESMSLYRGFIRRDRDVIAAEAYELPKEFPIYLNHLMELFKQ